MQHKQNDIITGIGYKAVEQKAFLWIFLFLAAQFYNYAISSSINDPNYLTDVYNYYG